MHNRKTRRIKASQMRGTITTINIDLDPSIPQGLNIPMGYKFTSPQGFKVASIEQIFVEKKFYWKIFKFFNKKYRPSVKVKVRFI